MSRDFILILGGGVVSLMTTLVVLFVSDYIYRRDELLYRKSLPPPKTLNTPVVKENAPNPNDSDKATPPLSTAQGRADLKLVSQEPRTHRSIPDEG